MSLEGDETAELLEPALSTNRQKFFCKPGLFIFLASASAWAYFWHWTPFSSPCSFDSLDPAAIDGILRFERMIGRQLPRHLRDLAGQEAHLRQLRVARAVNVQRPFFAPADSYALAQCVGAVYDMANYIGWTALNIDAMRINGTCPDSGGDTICAANAVGFLFNLMWVLNNVAQIPVFCVPNFNQNETASKSLTCLVSMSLFLASSLQITADGIAMKTDCEYLRNKDFLEFDSFEAMLQDRIDQLKQRNLHQGYHKGYQGVQSDGVDASNHSTLPAPAWARHRRLEADFDVGDGSRANALGICSMIIVQLANDLPYTGIDIWGAILDCGTRMQQPGEEFDEDCTSDVFSIVSDIVNLVTDFLVILAACKEDFPEEIPCTAESTDITSNLFALGAWAFTVGDACNPSQRERDSVNFDIPMI